MHAANAPTPGTTRPSAALASRASVLTAFRACPRDCPLCRADVARSVVEDDDRRHRDPLVLGMPSIRGSRAIASGVRVPGLELALDDVVRIASEITVTCRQIWA